MAPTQFSQAMQSIKDYGLHSVDAAIVAQHLKFPNFNEPIPSDIARVFNNLMHIVTMLILCIIILFLEYKLVIPSMDSQIHQSKMAKEHCSPQSYGPSSLHS
jgi:hypothetical protein